MVKELKFDNFTNEFNDVINDVTKQNLVKGSRKSSTPPQITFKIQDGKSRDDLIEYLNANYKNFETEDLSENRLIMKWVNPKTKKKEQITKQEPAKKETKEPAKEIAKESISETELIKKFGQGITRGVIKGEEIEGEQKQAPITSMADLLRKQQAGQKEKELSKVINQILIENKFLYLGEESWLKNNGILDDKLNIIDLLLKKGITSNYNEILQELNSKLRNIHFTPADLNREDEYLGMIKSNLLKKDGDKFVFSNEELTKIKDKLGFSFPTDKTFLFCSLIYNPAGTEELLTIKEARKNFDDFISLYRKNGNREKALLGIDEPINPKEKEEDDEPETYLFSFKTQDLFPVDSNKKNMLDYIDEIIEYMNGVLKYNCKCGWKYNPNEEDSFKLKCYSIIFTSNDHTKESILIINNAKQFNPKLLEDIDNIIKQKISDKNFNINLIRTRKKLTISDYASNQLAWKNQFKCPLCKKSIFKDAIFFINRVVYEMINAFRNSKPAMLVGNPGDGKSMIGLQLLEYCEWRYNIGYNLINVDESTSASTLRGGFSPLAIGGGKDVAEIRYGEITKALINPKWMDEHHKDLRGGSKGNSCGKNVLCDEMNRADFRNFAFLMGYFEAPYMFILPEDDSRIFPNPNKSGNRRSKWIFVGTMNTSDVGVESLSLAFKSRFSMIMVKYFLNEMIEILKRSMYGLNGYEERISREIIETTMSWQDSNDIVFPTGIRHVRSFLRQVRNGLNDLLNGKLQGAYIDFDKGYQGFSDFNYQSKTILTKQQCYQLEYLIRNLVTSLIVMPIVDENNATIVSRVIQNSDGIVSSCISYIKENLKSEYTLFTD